MCQISGHYKLSDKCPHDPWNLDSGEEGLSHGNPAKPRFYLMMLLHPPLQDSQHIRNTTAAAVVICMKVDKKKIDKKSCLTIEPFMIVI